MPGERDLITRTNNSAIAVLLCSSQTETILYYSFGPI